MPTMPTAPAAVDPNPAATAARLRLAVTRLHRVLRQQSADGLTLTQLSALATVGRFGPITLGDLAGVEQLSPPSVTKIVGKLEAADLVTRTVDPADRRVSRVATTPAGEHYLDEVRHRREAWLADRLTQLDPRDLARLADVIDLLEDLGVDPSVTAPASARPPAGNSTFDLAPTGAETTRELTP